METQKIKTSYKKAIEIIQGLNIPPDAEITISFPKSQIRKIQNNRKTLAQKRHEAFQAILNVTPSQGMRDIDEVIREIREEE